MPRPADLRPRIDGRSSTSNKDANAAALPGTADSSARNRSSSASGDPGAASPAVGPLRLVQAFAPVLAAGGGGAVVNVLSALTWLTLPGSGGYGASKSAAWALSNAMRQELRAQRTELLSVHAGYIDTDMARGAAGPKTSPEEIVRRVLVALEAGQPEVLADDESRAVHAGLTSEPPMYLGNAA